MGNFLADVGRSNILGTATQTISAIDSMQRNRALNEESAMRLQKEQYALNQQKKEDAWLDERVPLRSQPMYLQLSEGHKKKVDSFFVEQGGMNSETGMIERRNMLRGVKFMEETKEGMETFLKPILDEQLGELSQLQIQIKEAEAKGDTKKIQTLQPVLAEKTKRYGMGSKVYGGRLEQIEELEKIEAKRAVESKKWVPTTKEEALELKQAGRPQTTISLGTGAKTTLEKNIIETQSQIDAFNEIDNLFEDEYLTYPGRVRAKAEIFADKLGKPISKEWLTKRTRWFQITKERFLAYRKWVTGVAGGEKEMKEIAKAYFDPETNSPTQFRANLRQSKINAIRLQKRYRMFLEMGVTPTKKQLSTIPLSQIQLTPQELESIANIGGQFEVGTIYEDAHGNQKEYLGNGRWSD